MITVNTRTGGKQPFDKKEIFNVVTTCASDFDIDVQAVVDNTILNMFDGMTTEQIDVIKQKEIESLREIVQKQAKPNLPLWIALGFVGGLATSYGTIYVYDQITNE